MDQAGVKRDSIPRGMVNAVDVDSVTDVLHAVKDMDSDL